MPVCERIPRRPNTPLAGEGDRQEGTALGVHVRDSLLQVGNPVRNKLGTWLTASVLSQSRIIRTTIIKVNLKIVCIELILT